MKDFLENNISKLLGSAGLVSVFQFVAQLRDYLADGKLDNHEIQQLFMATTSAAQTGIIIAIVVYMKFFKNKD